MTGGSAKREPVRAVLKLARRSAMARPTIMQCAMALALLGWTALWAEALGLTHLLPLWTDALLFFAGLALIPLAQVTAAPPQPSNAAASTARELIALPTGSVIHEKE